MITNDNKWIGKKLDHQYMYNVLNFSWCWHKLITTSYCTPYYVFACPKIGNQKRLTNTRAVIMIPNFTMSKLFWWHVAVCQWYKQYFVIWKVLALPLIFVPANTNASSILRYHHHLPWCYYAWWAPVGQIGDETEADLWLDCSRFI